MANNSTTKPLFYGTNIAVVTPQRKDSPEADLAAALDIADHIDRPGVSSMALLGCTGEFLHFSLEERSRLIAFAVKRAKAPVLAGISHSSMAGVLTLAEQAIRAGVAGLLVMPPYFFRYDQQEILEFYRQVGERAGRSVPLFLYNVPFFTNPIAIETAELLLQSGMYAGIKDSSGDWDYLSRLIEWKKTCSFTLLIGNDAVFTRGRRGGADGVVSGVGCAIPELMLSMENAIQLQLPDKIERLETRLQEFLHWTNQFPVPFAIKEALRVRGIRSGPDSVPLSAEKLTQMGAFRSWFSDWLPKVLQEAVHA